MHEEWTGRGKSLSQASLDLVWSRDRGAGNAVGRCNRREVGVPFVAARRIGTPIQLLEMGDDAESMVIEDEHLDRELVLDDRRQLLDVHLERAVSDEAQHGNAGSCQGGPERGG